MSARRNLSPHHEATPSLTQAAEYGNLNVVRYLLDGGADPNEATETGHTPLWIASYKGNLGIVIELLDRHPALINSKHQDCGKTALHYAALGGNAVVAQELLRRGADVTSVDYANQTPLDFARREGHVEIVPLLVPAVEKAKAEKEKLLSAEIDLREWLSSQGLFTQVEAIVIARLMVSDNITSTDHVKVLTKETVTKWIKQKKLSDIQKDKFLYMHQALKQATEKCTSKKGKVFICHTGQDPVAKHFTAHLAGRLRDSGYEYFFDAHSVPAGVRWKAEIERNVQS